MNYVADKSEIPGLETLTRSDGKDAEIAALRAENDALKGVFYEPVQSYGIYNARLLIDRFLRVQVAYDILAETIDVLREERVCG